MAEVCPCGARARWMDKAPGGPHAGYRAFCERCVPACPEGWEREELSRAPIVVERRPMARANRLLR